MPLATWQACAERFLRQCDDSLRRRAVRSAPALRVDCRPEPPECTVSARRALPPLPGDVREAQKAVPGARVTPMPAQVRQIRATASPHGPAMSRGCSMSCASWPAALDGCPCSDELPSVAPCTSGEAGSAATTCRRRALWQCVFLPCRRPEVRDGSRRALRSLAGEHSDAVQRGRAAESNTRCVSSAAKTPGTHDTETTSSAPPLQRSPFAAGALCGEAAAGGTEEINLVDVCFYGS